MKKNLEENLEESNYVNRFEKEGNHKTWNYIIRQSAFSGLAATCFIDAFSDNLYMMGIGSLAFALSTSYALYNESKKKVKDNNYKSPSIM